VIAILALFLKAIPALEMLVKMIVAEIDAQHEQNATATGTAALNADLASIQTFIASAQAHAEKTP
jgi:hypothetical protein